MNGNEKEQADGRRGDQAAVDLPTAQSAIGAEHLRLEELIARTELALSRNEVDPQTMELAKELRDSMAAHFEREESLYYPTLWALRPEIESTLKKLLDLHQDFRMRLGTLVDTLERGEVEQAARQLDDFSARFGDHEAAEEQIIASLQQA